MKPCGFVLQGSFCYLCGKITNYVHGNRNHVRRYRRRISVAQSRTAAKGKPISYTILLLLFLLGISVGANDAIVNNLTTLGGQAFLIALAGTTGSVLAAWGVYRFFFKERRRE